MHKNAFMMVVLQVIKLGGYLRTVLSQSLEIQLIVLSVEKN